MTHLGVATGLGFCVALMASGTAFAGQPEGVEPAPAGDPTVGEPAADTTTTDTTTDHHDCRRHLVGRHRVGRHELRRRFRRLGAGAGGSFSASGSSSGGASASGSSEGDFPEANVDTGTGIDPFKGRVALGAIRTIAGLNGVNCATSSPTSSPSAPARAWPCSRTARTTPTTMDPCPGDMCELEESRTVAAMAFNFEALYFAKIGREAGQLPFRADFGLGGRFGIISIVNATDVADNLDDPLEMHVEIPLVFQLMFGNNFALSPEMGLDFRLVPGSRAAGDTNPGTNFPPTVSGDAVTGPRLRLRAHPRRRIVRRRLDALHLRRPQIADHRVSARRCAASRGRCRPRRAAAGRSRCTGLQAAR